MTRQQKFSFWVVGLVVFLIALYLLRSILLPFVAGMAVAYFLDPVCDRLEAGRLSRTLATTVVTFVFLLLVLLALLLVVPTLASQIASLIERLPTYMETLRGQLEQLVAFIELRLDTETLERLRGVAADSSQFAFRWATKLLGEVVSGGVALANLASLLFITPIVAFYLLRDWDRMIAKIDSWLPRPQADTIRQCLRDIDATLAGFVRGQGTVCVVLAIFYAIGLTASGLEFGLVIGLLAGLLSFIPFVGAGVGLVASVGLAIVQFDDWLRVGIVAGVFFLGQALEGNFLTPKLVGERVGLHPVWVIFALLAGGALFGFVGVLLAVPAAAVIGVMTRFSLARYLASPLYQGSGSAAPQPSPDDS